MSIKNATIIIVSATLLLVIGLLLGIAIDDFPILTLDPSVGLLDAASLCVTIAIGLVVPFLLKKWIDDSKSAKGYVIGELREFLQDISEISELTKNIFYNGKITSAEKTRINTSFETTDIKYHNLSNELKDFYDKETAELRDKLYKSYIEYWKYLTGSEIMSEKFKCIDEKFYKQATTLYLNVETKIKDIIRLMYK